jgi:hypothetical protein
MIFGFFTLLFSIKALGGSLHSTLSALGLQNVSGPITGTLISILMLCFFYLFSPSTKSLQNPTKTRKRFLIFLFLSLIGYGLTLHSKKILSYKADIAMADMIPAVTSGLEDIENLKSPYRSHVLSDGRVCPAYYLPGLWSVYLPFHLIGIDIRFAGVFSLLIFYFFLLELFLQRGLFKPYLLSAALFLLIIGLHLFSKIIGRQILYGHTAAFTIYLSTFLWSVCRRKFLLTALVLPLLFLSREMACFFALPYLFYLFRWERKDFYRCLKIGILIGLLITVPFLIASGTAFFDALFWYAKTTSNNTWQSMNQYYGLCGFLKWAGLVFLQPVFQLSGLVSAFYSLSQRKEKPEPEIALALGGIAYIPFIMFVSTTWNYLFLEPIVLLCFLLTLNRAKRVS